MATPSVTPNVTMIAPDGSIGDVPSQNVNAAMAAGGKIGIHVYSPDGTPGYVPHDRLGDALKAGATYSPAPKSSVATGNFIQNAVDQAASPDSPDVIAKRGTMSNYVNSFGRGATETLLSPLVHPLRTVQGIGSAIAHGSPYDPQNPIMGQIVSTGQDIQQNGIDAIPHIAGQVVGGAALGELGNAALGQMLPTPTNISPQYGAARSIAKAVLPKEAEFNGFVDALQREKGNIEQYATQNGLTTRTPLDMSVAAGKSADALGDLYRNQILGPNADQQVPVPPRFDRVGSQAPSGSRYATLGDIDKRIGELNDIIRPARLNATQGATATDLNALKDVVNEHDALVDILHNKLGAATNLDPSVIAGVRRSLGARNQLADQTLAGANRTSLQEGRIDRGVSTVKTPTVGGLVLDAVNKLRGGPEAIANRVYRNAYPKLDVSANIGNPASLDELRGANIADYLSGKR